MQDPLNEEQKAFWRVDKPQSDFSDADLWPTESRGNGLVVKNNAKTGAAQGKSSLIRKAPCRLCGFFNDLTLIDHSGGSLDGEGAGGQITTTTVSNTVSGGGTHTEAIGTQAYRRAAGCALCWSKNSTKMRLDVLISTDPYAERIKPLGF